MAELVGVRSARGTPGKTFSTNSKAALYAYPVQAAAATAATMGKAKVLGLIREKSAVLTAKVSSEVLHGETKEQMPAAVERLREHLGTARADRLIAFTKSERMSSTDGSVEPVEDDDQEGDESAA